MVALKSKNNHPGQVMDAVPGTTTRANIVIGQNHFPIESFEGKESINEPFQFKLILSHTNPLSTLNLLGQHSLLIIESSSTTNSHSTVRKLSGIISEHRQLNPYTIESSIIKLTFEPRMVFSKLSGKPRVFTKITSLDLVFKLLKEHGYTDNQLFFPEQQTKHLTRPHWVQAEHETDFEFIHRILSREGINYFWQPPNQFDEEVLCFYQNHKAHPINHVVLKYQETAGLVGESDHMVFKLSVCQKPNDYRVKYLDFDPQNPDKAAQSSYGSGDRQVVVWGYGAQSHEELHRAAKHHHEYLVMLNELYKAQTHQLDLKIGCSIHMTHLPKFTSENMFQLLTLKHCFKAGAYYNDISFIPQKTPVRPRITKRKAGQTVHTAIIHSNDDNPYLNRAGEYRFSNHIHHSDSPSDQQMTAPRLTPFAGQNALQQTMGMHFPLRKNAEVLVMYLHNDFNQPILQNSPDNGINTPPIRQDNSWQSIIKTAWGQYLSMSDQKGQERIVLAGNDEHNKLELAHPNAETPCASLISQRGGINLDAHDHMTLKSQGDLSTSSETSFQIDAEEKMEVHAEKAHHQSVESFYQATKKMSIKAEERSELSAPIIELSASNNITMAAKGAPVQIELENGDIEIEVNEITLSALNEFKMVSNQSAVILNQTGIHFYANSIQLSGEVGLGGLLVEDSKPVPPVICSLPSVGLFKSVPIYPFHTLQIINKPNWSQSLHFAKDMATLEVDIRGFDGHEALKLAIFRYHQQQNTFLPVFPPINQLQNLEEVKSFTFHLGDESIYRHQKQAQQTPGSATLALQIPVQDLLNKSTDSNQLANDVYYAHVEINNIACDYYSGPLLILTAANIKIVTDRGLPYQNDEAVLGMLRSLPDNLKQHPQCPSPKVLKYYRDENQFKSLVIGQGNRIQLTEDGEYKELMGEVNSIPIHRQYLRVDADDTQKQIFKRLMPPMIADLRHARKTDNGIEFAKKSPDARVRLKPDEMDYIEENGRNLTIFIHGFNVNLGSFGHHINEIKIEKDYVVTPSPEPYRYSIKKLTPSYSDAKATIYRDEYFLKQQFPDVKHMSLKSLQKHLNGSGACEWITHLERHLNEAAGFDGENYDLYTRCLHVIWPGAPDSPLNYVQAVYESARMGEIVAVLLQNIISDIPGIKVHVIAHSQGNGVMLHALEKLGEAGRSIEHATFWQAAIPHDALSDRGLSEGSMSFKEIAEKQKTNLWFCPYAHKGANKFLVLHSRNDNILGRLLTQKEQPFGVKLRAVWHTKPIAELGTSLVLARLALESLYQVAVKLNAVLEDFFDQDRLSILWQKWIVEHPSFYCIKTNTYHRCAPTLEKQYQLLVSLKQDGFNDGLRAHLRSGQKRCKQLLIDYFWDSSDTNLDHQISQSDRDISPHNKLSTALHQFADALHDILSYLEVGSNFFMYHVRNHIFKHIEENSPTIASITTFMHTVLVMRETKEKPAMGYEEAQKSNKSLKKLKDTGKLVEIETTEWIWEHSHMKIANEEIKKNVFKKIINYEKGISSFGKYEIKKNQ